MKKMKHLFIDFPIMVCKSLSDFIIDKLNVVFKIIGLRGLFYLGTIALLYAYYHSKSLDVLLPIIVGIFISDLLKTIYDNLLVHREDKLKTSHNMTYLEELYGRNYVKELKFNGSKVEFLYGECFVNTSDHQILIKDQPNRMFELDSLMKASYADIMKAHKGSYIKNFNTIRLDNFSIDSNTLKLTTSRSNYYNHLLTNRAIDYEFEKNISVRKVFEYGPYLSEFQDAKMSNHIGINGIVLLNDGYTLIPKRGKQATYSKNKITASIAFPLTTEILDETNSEWFTYEVLQDEIRRLLKTRLYIDDTIYNTEAEIRFLGFGREVYEGGKPQFYFMIKLKSISSQNYLQLLEENKKHMNSDKMIDQDDYIYVCDLLSMKLDKKYGGTIGSLNYYRKKIKFSSVEMSFLANYWHLEQMGLLELFNVDNPAYNLQSEDFNNPIAG